MAKVRVSLRVRNIAITVLHSSIEEFIQNWEVKKVIEFTLLKGSQESSKKRMFIRKVNPWEEKSYTVLTDRRRYQPPQELGYSSKEGGVTRKEGT